MRQIILDTETTGLNWRTGNRVVEIGCVELVERRPTGNHFHRYLKPDCDFEQGAQDHPHTTHVVQVAREKAPARLQIGNERRARKHVGEIAQRGQAHPQDNFQGMAFGVTGLAKLSVGGIAHIATGGNHFAGKLRQGFEPGRW